MVDFNGKKLGMVDFNEKKLGMVDFNGKKLMEKIKYDCN